MRASTGSSTTLRGRSAGVLARVALLGGAAALSTSPAFAQLAGWTQQQGDAAHTGATSEGPGVPYRLAWRAHEAPGGPDDQFGMSAPIVVGDTVVSVGPTSVAALDLSSGAETWRVKRSLGPSVSPAAARSSGATLIIFTEGFAGHPPSASASPESSPSAVSPTPSAGAEGAGSGSRIVAVDAATRKRAWRGDLKDVSRTGVTVDGDSAFAGDNRGNVYAVDVATGDVRWTAQAGGPLTTAIAVSNGTVVVTTQGTRTSNPAVVAFRESDGSELWREEPSGAAFVACSPSIGDGLVYTAFFDQTVRAFDLASGAERWSTRINSPVPVNGAAAVTDGSVIVLDVLGEVYRLDAETGERVWDFAINEPVRNSPPIVVGNRILAATALGRLAAVDLGSGRLVWKTPRSSSLLRNLVPAGDVIVGVRGGAQNGLVAYRHDPAGSLVSVTSPTTLSIGRLVGGWAAAAAPLAAVLVLVGRPLLARMGPVGEDEGSDADDEEDDLLDEDGEAGEEHPS